MNGIYFLSHFFKTQSFIVNLVYLIFLNGTIVNGTKKFLPKLLGKSEIKIYKAFYEDLLNIGYSFSSSFLNKISYNHRNHIKVYSEFNYYLPSELITSLNNKNNKIIKVINH